ncbi:MAG: respiratory nitrate reductase subunit gamma [Thermodesulfobacteriota bacterium]
MPSAKLAISSSPRRLSGLTLTLAGLVLGLALAAPAAAGWRLDPAKYHVSAHGQLSCLDCHAGTPGEKTHPDPARVNRVPKESFRSQACYECHAEIQGQLKAGRHGRRAVDDPARYGFCIECHDPHATRATNPDVAGKFKPGVPRQAQCAACHDAKTQPPAPAAELKDCYACHMAPAKSAAPAAAAASDAQFCLGCHGQANPAAKDMPVVTAADFRKDNPHQALSCLTCHPQGARYPHHRQQAVDCASCHPVRHDEKKAGGDLHLGVSCQACHLEGVGPWRDAKTGRVLWRVEKGQDGLVSVHSLTKAADEAACARCHQAGNKIGAATMVLPAKSVICMPCHTATFSAGDATSLAALIVFAVGLIAALGFWFTGAPAAPAAPGHGGHHAQGSALGRALTALVLDGVFQRRLWRISPLRGLIHNLIFFPFVIRFTWGMAALIGTLIGPEQDWAYYMADKNSPGAGFVFDLTGLMVVLGVAGAIGRRLASKAPRPAGLPRPDWLALGLMAGIVVVGFILEAARIAMTGAPARAGWAFVGYALSHLFSQAGAQAAYAWLWYVHAVFTGAFLAYLPFSRMFHILIAPIVLMINAAKGHGR